MSAWPETSAKGRTGCNEGTMKADTCEVKSFSCGREGSCDLCEARKTEEITNKVDHVYYFSFECYKSTEGLQSFFFFPLSDLIFIIHMLVLASS